jgi:hypothetical protein
MTSFGGLLFAIINTMQSLNDDEEKQVLGEVLADKLDTIMDYVKDVPALGQELHKVHATVNEISDRLTVIEHVVREHESGIKHLKRKTA